MSRTHSLRFRLLGGMVVVFTLGLAASLVDYRYEVNNIVKDVRGRTLEAQARELLAAMHVGADGRLDLNLSPNWQHVYADTSRQFAYTVFDRAHKPIARSPNLRSPLSYIPVHGPGPFGPVEFIGVEPHRSAVLAATSPEGDVLVVTRSGSDPDILIDSLFEEDSSHLLLLAPLALTALALIWLVSGWSLRPVARASREAALIGPGKPGTRISPEALPREIQPLVEAVNGALDRLSTAYAAELRLTANAAHELRTPLAVLHLRLQRARLTGTADWPAIEREIGHISRLVNQLIDLARKESLDRDGKAGALPVVNLSRVVREAAAIVLPLIESQGRRIDAELPDNVPVRGRADDLCDMVRNLLDNALIHGRGTVTVRLYAAADACDRVTIEIYDEGDGVPAGQEEFIFERFRRLKTESPGSGLGLAIVRQVARSHGGDVRFVAGRGQVTVWLPAYDTMARPHRKSAG